MANQSQGELYPQELEDAFKLCRIANANEPSEKGDPPSFRYLVNCRVHEPIGPGNILWIEDFVEAELITEAELEDRLGEDLLARFSYKRSTKNA